MSLLSRKCFNLSSASLQLILLGCLLYLPARTSGTCPAGYSCDSGGATQLPCPTGTFSLEGSLTCTLCPSGSKCPTTSSAPTVCSGTGSEQFSYEGSDACSQCPAGFECPSLSSTPTACQSGFYSVAGAGYCSLCPAGYSCGTVSSAPIVCASGRYAQEGATYCSICPLGFYCPAQAQAPLACPSGTWAPQGSTQCQACPVGYFCPSTKVPAPLPCATGFYSGTNSTACAACPPGYSCGNPAASPQSCPEGSFSLGYQWDCVPCPSGYYCPSTSALPVICPAGKQSLAGQSECQDCIAGVACPTLNNEGANSQCSSGYYRVNDGHTKVCRGCPPGHYCPTPDVTPRPCPPGAFALGQAATCATCQAGYYCPSTTQTQIACPKGTFQPLTGQTFCQECPIGSSCSSATVSSPSACSAGTYAPTGNATSCLTCPEGFYCPTNSTTLPIGCPLGSYSGIGAKVCTKCEGGYMCPTTQLSQRTACSSATGYFSFAGSSHCFLCPQGMSCQQVATSTPLLSAGEANVTLCPDGTYANEGASICSPCPAGFGCYDYTANGLVKCHTGFYSLLGESICHPCPAGSKCPSTAGVGIALCSPGTFSSLGLTDCYPCPPGYQCPFPDRQFLERCSAGTYSLGNQALCIECPEHFECPHRDSLVPLRDGFYSPKGTSVALKCQAGFMCKMQVPAGTKPQVLACESGTYSPTGASNCTTCPAGFYCLATDLGPLPCPEGFFNALPGQTTCQRCPQGTISAGTVCSPILEGSSGRSPYLTMDTCQYGSYSDSTTIANQVLLDCQKCEPGVVCGNGQSSANAGGLASCPSGFWCNVQNENGYLQPQQACPPGTYSTGLVGQSNQGQACQVCPSGSYCEGADKGPKLCVPGYYCPIGTNRSSEYPCTAGTYNSLSGQQASSACIPCPIGSFCPEGSAVPYPCPPGAICPYTGVKDQLEVPCPAGQYQPLSSQTSCISCPAGAFCPPGSAYPQLCPAGTFNGAQSASHQTDCMQCPSNSLCPIYGMTAPQSTSPPCETGYLCPPGTEYAQSYPCPAGTQGSVAGLTDPDQCGLCPNSYACPQGASSNTVFTIKPMSCEPGYFCPSATAHDKQYPCPGGYYSASSSISSATQCLTCSQGYYCPPGSYKMYRCPSGYYCPVSTENYQHFPCPNGTYSLTRGLSASTQCQACPTGYFCKQGMTFPEACPLGSYMDETGAFMADDSTTASLPSLLACKTCQSGYYCNSTGLTQQLPCPPGFFSPPGSMFCYLCEAGHYCLTKATTVQAYSTNLCPAGSWCPVGTLALLPCPAAYFCPLGAERPMPCPSGTYSSTTGGADLSVCLPVPAGYFTSFEGSTSYTQNPCGVGYYCPVGSQSGQQMPCPVGQYQNLTAQSTCQICPAGFFCNGTTTTPTSCPQGYYCSQGASSLSMCPKGTFGNQVGLVSSSDCQSCKPGQYCSQDGLAAPDGLCDPGYYCLLGAQTPNPTDGLTGNVCPPGGFCEVGSKKISNCPPGTFNPSSKGKTQNDCQACPPGSYCQGSNLPSPTGLCQAGYYCSAGSTIPTQTPAPPGYYSQAGASSATLCPVGTYNPFTGMPACLPCPAGFYCDIQGISNGIQSCPTGYFCPQNSSEPTKCPIATFNNVSNAHNISDCQQCSPGYYCASEGLTNPTGQCEQGYFCLLNASQAVNDVLDPNGLFGPCPVGFYCPIGTSWPLPCPTGTFSNSLKATSASTCNACTAGSYCAHAGISAPDGLCDSGFYCPTSSRTPRPPTTFCLPGHYCPLGSSLPIACSPGSYQSQSFQATCLECPAGYFCGEGQVLYSTNPCPPGYRCPAGTQYNTSFPCDPGSYQPLPRRSSCVLCPAGSYCLQPGLSAPNGQCSGGFYCRAGSPSQAPTASLTSATGASYGDICPIGFYCPPGSGFPLPCPPGAYCDRSGLSTYTGLCAGGYYCQSQATKATPLVLSLDGGSLCPSGHYCPTGSSAPLPCQPGYYQSTAGIADLANCLACPSGMFCESAGLSQPSGYCEAGFYCPAGSTSSRPDAFMCPSGSRCPSGSGLPVACSTSTYQDKKGQSVCNVCPAGYFCNATAITQCGQNFYCPYAMMDRVACPAGTYGRVTNSSSLADCFSCPAGKYCESNALAGIEIQTCPAGYYCSGGASSALGTGLCPQGSFCPLGSPIAIPCPPGKYCGAEGLASPQGDCSASYYCNAGSSSPSPSDGTHGNLCPIGYYCPSGAIQPVACPLGTYLDTTGKSAITDCIACPAGSKCNSRGLTAPSGICAPGFYCPDATSTIPCPAGYQCPQGSFQPQQCASGYYQPDTQQSTCTQCPSRYYCPSSTPALAINCPPGSYCPSGSSSPSPCPAGTFNSFHGLGSLSECQSCQEGHYCPSANLTEPGPLCNAGYYCIGGSSTQQPNDGATGNVCPIGSYCPAGSVTPLLCPIGTYSDSLAGASISVCQACKVGYYCPQRGRSSSTYQFGAATTFACGAGFLCLSGAMDPNPTVAQGGSLCPAGFTCLADAEGPHVCPASSYQPNTGATACLSCPAGLQCSTPGTTNPTLCPLGFYCPAQSSSISNLYPCPPGTYSPFSGLAAASDCTPCKEGHYCSGGGTAPDGECLAQYYCPLGSSARSPNAAVYAMDGTTPGMCPPGYFCPQGTVAPLPCPVGTYQPDPMGISCLPCPAGHYCDALAIDYTTIQLKLCLGGYVCFGGALIPSPNDGVTGRKCSPGNYCPQGAIAMIPCSGGSYEYREASTECQSCMAGFYCPTGSVQPLPCPVGSFCLTGQSTPELCPDGSYGVVGRLEVASQCASCPAGRYCQSGIVAGSCAAGFYCDFGATSATDFTKLCPAGHYCTAGTLYPTRCPAGTVNNKRGGKTSDDCTPCRAGFYCLENGNTEYPCPKGYYCDSGTSEPKACPTYTYLNRKQGIQITDCQPCPPGYLCTTRGIADYTAYPCPVGKYCPDVQTSSSTSCPSGTYRDTPAAASVGDCHKCPQGSYCPQAAVQPYVCPNGTYCIQSSSTPQLCPKGAYCPTASPTITACPQAFFCASSGSDLYAKCPNGTYCSTGTIAAKTCPAGSFGTGTTYNFNASTSCQSCDAGYYSLEGQNTCNQCTAGFVCQGNTTSATPSAADNGYTCPAGYYCPQGSTQEVACPKGTWSNQLGMTSLADCQNCPENYYGDALALTACAKCYGSSRSVQGSSTCVCLGLNRLYLKDTKSCVCQTGYITLDGSSSSLDSASDCQQIVYARCTGGQQIDTNGLCRDVDNCTAECNGGPGRLQTGIGVCQCSAVVSADDICDASCRGSSLRATFGSDGKVLLLDPVTKTQTSINSLRNVTGSLVCSQADSSKCQLVSLSKNESNGDFLSDYQLSSRLTTLGRRLETSKFYQPRQLSSLSTTVSGFITNPVVCITQGSAVLFDSISSAHYPVYQKDSLLNSNANFDFGQFLVLQQQVLNGSTPGAFVFTFQESGVYTIADSGNSAKQTIISVMGESQQCPSSIIYQSQVAANLLKVGVAQNTDVIYTPDWGFFFGAVMAFLALILLLVFVITYVYRKSWRQVGALKKVSYQQKQYSELTVEDPEDQDAVVSIHAENSAFSFLHQGKEVLRTHDQVLEKREQERLDQERRNKKPLELDDVEDLKEKLGKHLNDIRGLFGSENLEESSDEEDEDRQEFKGVKMMDMIAKLKEIIDENKRILQGEEIQDERALFPSGYEEETSIRGSLEKKRKVQEALAEREKKFEAAQQGKQLIQAEALDAKKDEVVGKIERDVEKRRADLFLKMQLDGNELSEQDKERMLNEYNSNMGKIGDMLLDDEVRQGDMLKMRLEERKLRRKKLQDKLNEVEQEIERREDQQAEKKEEIELQYHEELAKLEKEMLIEKVQKQHLIDEDLERLKQDKLVHFEDRLKAAKNTKDFDVILEEFQLASKRVDHELTKEKIKQETDLERALKARKGQRKAQLEKDKNEKLKIMYQGTEAETEGPKEVAEQIKQLLKLEDSSSNAIYDSVEKIQKSHQDLLQDNENESLAANLRSMLRNKLEEMGHFHTQEMEELHRKQEVENLKQDRDIEIVKEEINNKLSSAIGSEVVERDAIKKKLEGKLDEDERQRLLEKLKAVEELIQLRMSSEQQAQGKLLEQKLALRRKRKEGLIEKEYEVKSRHLQEKKFEEQISSVEDLDLKRKAARETLVMIIKDLQINLASEELPYAVQKVIDDKQSQEMEDMLVRLFEEKARDLKDEVLALLEERFSKEAEINKEFKDKQEALKSVQDHLGQYPSEAELQNLKASREDLVAKQSKALKELDWQYQEKQSAVERVVNERVMDRENEKLGWLKQKQLEEKKELIAEYLPESILKHLVLQHNEEEIEELDQYKQQLELEKQKKLQELDRQREQLNKEMADQRQRLNDLDKANQLLQHDELLASKVEKHQMRRKRDEATSQDQIERLKREYQAVTQQLTSTYSEERKRQLQMLQDRLRERQEELIRQRDEEERQQKVLAEQQVAKEQERAAAQKEIEAQVSKLRQDIESRRRVIDKPLYSKSIQQVGNLYEQLQRRKENRNNDIFTRRASVAIPGLNPSLTQIPSSASKEQQLTLLSDILEKIEGLESKVKVQLLKAKRLTNVSVQDPQKSYLSHTLTKKFISSTGKVKFGSSAK